jgi:hypothetical protein
VSSHRGSEVTDAIVAALTTAQLLVGDGEAPVAGGWEGTPGASDFVPYVDVHPIPGGYSDGTVAEPDSDGGALYQLISVGASRTQAENIGDEVREAMTSTALTLASGRQVALVRVEMLGGAMRDDSLRGNAVQPSVWMVSDRYRILTVPA